MKYLTAFILVFFIGCSSTPNKASKAPIAGKNQYAVYKVLDIERRLGWGIHNRSYYPTNRNIDAVYITIEIKNISDSSIEVSLQPVIPLQGGEIHRIARIDYGENFFERLKYFRAQYPYETEAINLKNEIINADSSIYRQFIFVYPINQLPPILLFQAKKVGENKFDEIPVLIPKEI
jgi:hypothetical protein